MTSTRWARIDLFLELKNNARKLLLAIVSVYDSENAEKILYNMNPKQLADVGCTAFHQESLDDEADNDDSSSGGDVKAFLLKRCVLFFIFPTLKIQI